MGKIKYLLMTLLASSTLAFASAPIQTSAASFFDNAKDQACKGANIDGSGSCDPASGKTLSNVIKTIKLPAPKPTR